MYKIVLRGFGILAAIGGSMAMFQYTTPENLLAEPEFVGLAALFCAAMLATGVMCFLMAQVDEPRTRIKVCIATLVWLVLNVGAHLANYLREIEPVILPPVIISSAIATLLMVAIYQERTRLKEMS